MHSIATPSEGASCEVPVYVEIVQHEGAYYLFRNRADGVCIADTWHLTVQEAKEQAAFEYGITDDDWVEATAT